MKAVLMSIQPKWCELIASGKKTVEVRKTKPKLETPFKVYIYCTQGKDLLTSVNGIVNKPNEIVIDLTTDSEIQWLNDKVIGEFVCQIIGKTSWFLTPDHPKWQDMFDEETCLTNRETYEYSKGDIFYEWHISDLVIYDKPRELSEFKRWVDRSKGQKYHEDMLCLQRPPQSWCYVEV